MDHWQLFNLITSDDGRVVWLTEDGWEVKLVPWAEYANMYSFCEPDTRNLRYTLLKPLPENPENLDGIQSFETVFCHDWHPDPELGQQLIRDQQRLDRARYND